MQRNWVFATNSNFLIPKSLQPGGVDLWYFKLWLFDLPKTKVWNFKGLRNRVVNINESENQNLWPRLNSFVWWTNSQDKADLKLFFVYTGVLSWLLFIFLVWWCRCLLFKELTDRWCRCLLFTELTDTVEGLALLKLVFKFSAVFCNHRLLQCWHLQLNPKY